jgi:uncharacterized protein (TIGR02677 family)
LAYATEERQRRIMRVFFNNKTRDLGWMLSPLQVQERLWREFAYPIERDALEGTLGTLVANGSLRAERDNREVDSAREWRRRRDVYDITAVGERVERLLIEIDSLGEQLGSLDGQRLLAVRDSLRRIGQQLEGSHPDAGAIDADLRVCSGSVRDLLQGAADFMQVLRDFIGAEQLDGERFVDQQDAVLSHLRGFHRDLRSYEDPIRVAIEAIECHGVDRMLDLALSARALPPAIGEQTEAEIRAAARDALGRQWAGVHQFFCAAESPLPLLTTRVYEAIKAILDIAERLIDRRAGRRDRANAWNTLATMLAVADEHTARTAFGTAAGMRRARHFGVEYPDQEGLRPPGGGLARWVSGEPVVVAAHLRRPGTRKGGAGTPATIAAPPNLRDRVRARQEMEERQLQRLLDRLGTGATLRMGDLHRLEPVELDHLLQWISRAFALPSAADGSRRATSTDGRRTLRLTPPGDGERCVVEAVHGRLDSPNYWIEVL